MGSSLYKLAQNEVDLHGDGNACAVVAVMVATGLGYADVIEVFNYYGRKRGKGTPRITTELVLRALGYELVELVQGEDYHSTTVRQLDSELLFRDELARKVLLVGVSRHILCCRDGNVQDWTKSRKKRIVNVWQVKPLELDLTL